MAKISLNLSKPDLKKEKELNLRLNKNVGEWDWSLLSEFGETALADIGFSSEELDDIFNIEDIPEQFDLENELLNNSVRKLEESQDHMGRDGKVLEA